MRMRHRHAHEHGHAHEASASHAARACMHRPHVARACSVATATELGDRVSVSPPPPTPVRARRAVSSWSGLLKRTQRRWQLLERPP